MKKILFSISFSLIANYSFGQWVWNLDFDNNTNLERVYIDTVSNQNCIWQIGKPMKSIFNSAYSFPNAIVTDTFNSYPINDTSSFIIFHDRSFVSGGGNESLILDFYFKMNSDSLSDFGKIEASIDNGQNWVNLLTQDSSLQLYWLDAKPVLTGNTNGWVHYSEELSSLTYNLGFSDTLLYRFTFTSDSIQTNKDGWMIDEFSFQDWWEGIPEIQNDNLISIYPNPADENLFIQNLKRSNSAIVQVFNYTGQLVFDNKNFKEENIDTKNLQNGFYVLKYSDGNNYSVKKFLVQH